MSMVVAPEDFRARWSEVRTAAERLGCTRPRLRSAVHLVIDVADGERIARAEAKRFASFDQTAQMDRASELLLPGLAGLCRDDEPAVAAS